MGKQKSPFEREVLTHLKYMKEVQEESKKHIEKLFDKIDEFPEKLSSQVIACNKKFNGLNTEITKAKGFFAGVIFVSSVIGAGIGFLISVLLKVFK